MCRQVYACFWACGCDWRISDGFEKCESAPTCAHVTEAHAVLPDQEGNPYFGLCPYHHREARRKRNRERQRQWWSSPDLDSPPPAPTSTNPSDGSHCLLSTTRVCMCDPYAAGYPHKVTRGYWGWVHRDFEGGAVSGKRSGGRRNKFVLVVRNNQHPTPEQGKENIVENNEGPVLRQGKENIPPNIAKGTGYGAVKYHTRTLYMWIRSNAVPAAQETPTRTPTVKPRASALYLTCLDLQREPLREMSSAELAWRLSSESKRRGRSRYRHGEEPRSRDEAGQNSGTSSMSATLVDSTTEDGYVESTIDENTEPQYSDTGPDDWSDDLPSLSD